MKNIKFIIGKTNTGFSAYAADNKYPLTTVGETMEELKEYGGCRQKLNGVTWLARSR